MESYKNYLRMWSYSNKNQQTSQKQKTIRLESLL